MFAAKMSRARLNTGPLNQAGDGGEPRRGGLFPGHQRRRADRNLGFENLEFRH